MVWLMVFKVSQFLSSAEPVTEHHRMGNACGQAKVFTRNIRKRRETGPRYPNLIQVTPSMTRKSPTRPQLLWFTAQNQSVASVLKRGLLSQLKRLQTEPFQSYNILEKTEVKRAERPVTFKDVGEEKSGVQGV